VVIEFNSRFGDPEAQVLLPRLQSDLLEVMLADLDEGVLAFHAGIERKDDGTLVTAGGRVLTLVATGETLEAARDLAYRNVQRIGFEGVYYRRDIGATARDPLTTGAARV
jgi:phosphoribosylamine--glycine ligase